MTVEPAPARQAPIAPAARAAAMRCGQLRVGRGAVGLVEAVLGEQREDVASAGGEARHADGHASEIRDGVGARHGVGQDAAHLAVASRRSGIQATITTSAGGSSRIDSTRDLERDARGEPAERAPARRCPGGPRCRVASRRTADVSRSRPASAARRNEPGDRRGGARAEPALERDRVVHLDPPREAIEPVEAQLGQARPRAPRRAGSIDRRAARRPLRPRRELDVGRAGAGRDAPRSSPAATRSTASPRQS